MGANKRVIEERQQSHRSKSGKQKNKFYTWKPQGDEIGAMQDYAKDLGDVLADLPTALERGLFLKVSMATSGDSWFAALIEPGEWGSNPRALSVWHSNPVRAVVGLLYAVTHVFPEFPDDPWPPTDFVEDW